MRGIIDLLIIDPRPPGGSPWSTPIAQHPPRSRGNDTLRTVLAEGQSLLDPDAVERALQAGVSPTSTSAQHRRRAVATQPLALRDAVSVRPEHLVVFEIH